MIKTKITLKNVFRLQHHPFPVQGFSGRIYGHALFSNECGGHVIEMEFDPDKTPAVLEDIVRGSHRPNSQWYVCAVEATSEPTNAELELAQMVDEAQTRLDEARTELETSRAELAALRDEMAKLKVVDEPVTKVSEPLKEIVDEPIDPDPEMLTSPPPATREGLSKLSFRQKRALCKELGIDTKGINDGDFLVERILAHESATQAAN